MAKSLEKMAPRHRAETGVCHIKDLVADPANRRKHNPRNIGMVVDALQQVGAARSIVIDERNVVLAGNGVSEAAMEAGITRVQVVEVDGSTLVAVRRTGLTEAQKRALAMFDNRAGELAEWDPEQLAADAAAGLGLKPWFSDEELAAVLGTKVEPAGGLTDPDDVPAVRATDIQLGDLFELGKHRLLCGDSTKPDDFAQLMRGETVDAVFTDPPYGIGYQAMRAGTRRIANAASLTEAADVLRSALAFTHATPVHFVCCGWRSLQMVLDAMVSCQIEPKACIVWDKKRGVQNLDRYFKQHEFVVYAGPYGGQTTMGGDIWAFDRDFDPKHATPKPVALIERALETATEVGAAVFEPFSGSGSTIIAAARQNRTCRAIELEAEYVQVAIDRWEAFTGQQAQKVGEAVRA